MYDDENNFIIKTIITFRKTLKFKRFILEKTAGVQK